jgi:hypothetical protein
MAAHTVLADRRQYLKLSEFEPDMDDKRCMCTDPIHDLKTYGFL